MGKKFKWSWTSALIGAASAAAATAVILAKPRDPTFDLISVDVTSFKLKFPSVEAELLLTVCATNPNIAPAHYSPTTVSIFYDGSLLGSADVAAGSHPSKSCQVLRLPARLDGGKLAHNAGRFFADVARREVVLDTAVDVAGDATIMWWDRKFKVHVDSRVTVDPVFLDVIDQEHKSQLEVSYLW
ncbi:uncharacterized protein LOC116198707 [Punica granatum]|uniref:Water stress and hypersensitive response domain-containing protein n=2 Tax=Punica granatum TaxID=22663 RepID=A0A218WLY1_PUNGR|nr:uncharacterized protein LOC116198707 [Punica granatum]OWM73646.1 hypothetical protein CDL15_Pgr026745 [Punica granatum]PKI53704.1 hypothetical protein CRG98_025945 [Punica granatum]